jgi:hypothetical protein
MFGLGSLNFMLETAALSSMNIVPNFTHFYAPLCCALIVLGDSTYVSCAAVHSHLVLSSNNIWWPVSVAARSEV